MQHPIDTITIIELKLLIERIRSIEKKMEEESMKEISIEFLFLEIEEELPAFKNLLQS